MRGKRDSLSAYLVNMAIRLNALKRVMKSTAVLYLHCDPKASHYLKLVLDHIFGPSNFRNEIIWCYSGGGIPAKDFPRKHDVILRYCKEDKQPYKYRPDFRPYSVGTVKRGRTAVKGKYFERGLRAEGTPIEDWWTDIPKITSPTDPEKLGYPTQKSTALLRRIIRCSTDEGDTVLDPFCGCGTTLHAAEEIRRPWIGIDISRFSIGVVKSRLAESFEGVLQTIGISGIPTTVESALALAKDNPWEFEKWICGQLGAKGLYKRPGAKGADGGIDGVVDFFAQPDRKSYAIVQVKGGKVKVNDVKALNSDVESEPMASAGVFVCFSKYRATAEKAGSKKTFTDGIAGNRWPVVQILTVEDVLTGAMPRLPNQVIQQGYGTKRADAGFPEWQGI